MSQSKDADRPAAVSPEGQGREQRERRLELLLEERARLIGRVRRLDRVVAGLRREALAATQGPDGSPQEVVFALRGEDAERGAFEAPAGVEASDLRECLAKVVLAARRAGARIEGLELLVACEPTSGRVRSIAARQPGTREWVTQLRRSHEKEGPGEPA